VNAPAPVDLLLRDATVLPLTEAGGVLAHTDVAIAEGAIAAVGPTGTLRVAPARTLEAHGRLLLPGLVNTHTHLGQTFMRGTAECMRLEDWLQRNRPYTQQLTAEDVYWFSLLGIVEMLRAGITTLADMFFFEEAVAEAAQLAGVRACLGQGIIEVPGAEGTYGPAEKRLQNSADFARRWHGAADGRITARLAPHSLYTISEGTLRETAAAARDLGVGVHTHVSETQTEVENCQAAFGRTPPAQFEHWGFLEAPFLAAHCVHLTPADIGLLDRPGVGVAHNPSSNMKLASGQAPVPRLLECAGLAVGLGTDSAASNDTLDLWKEMHLTALWHSWPEGAPAARRCLEMATRDGARALGMSEQIGTVEAGKRADLILVDLEQPQMAPLNSVERALVYAGLRSKIDLVLVDGEVVLEDGALLTVDEQEVLAQARGRARRLLAGLE
jgi:5-methylthioadenosine/S-adenosylhomocysteine deaminase